MGEDLVEHHLSPPSLQPCDQMEYPDGPPATDGPGKKIHLLVHEDRGVIVRNYSRELAMTGQETKL